MVVNRKYGPHFPQQKIHRMWDILWIIWAHISIEEVYESVAYIYGARHIYILLIMFI